MEEVIKLKSLEQTLIQSDWCPYKREYVETERQQDLHAQGKDM